MLKRSKQEKEFLDATREEAIQWLSERDAARYRKDVEKENRPSLLERLGVSHAKKIKDNEHGPLVAPAPDAFPLYYRSPYIPGRPDYAKTSKAGSTS